MERFWSKVDKRGPDECWEWQGAKREFGYGVIRIAGKQRRAHRVALQLSTGVSSHLPVLHSCDNPACVNPTHLRYGTLQDNIKDKVERQRQARGTSCYLARLTDEQVIEARRRNKLGENATTLAKYFGISVSGMSDILRGRVWSHLPQPSKDTRVINKLSANQVREIRRLKAAGDSNRSLAERFHISISNVKMIIHHKTWSHV